MHLHPQETKTLFSHDDVQTRIIQAWENNTFPQALLLSGPKGIGKATLAYKIARFLLSQNKQKGTLDLKDDDPAFHFVSKKTHPNLVVIEKTFDDKKNKLRNEIIIDDIRNISSFSRLTSFDGDWRVVIVDAAEDMNRNAANALLKTLEEPPEKTIIILITHMIGKLLPTIKSRCWKMSLQALTKDDFLNWLDKQEVSLSDQDKLLLFSLSHGCPGKALKLIEIDGVKLYHSFYDLAQNFKDKKTTDSQAYISKIDLDQEAVLSSIKEFFFSWINDQIKLEASQNNKQNIRKWFQLTETLKDLFLTGETLYLDKKQMILNGFFHLEEAS